MKIDGKPVPWVEEWPYLGVTLRSAVLSKIESASFTTAQNPF